MVENPIFSRLNPACFDWLHWCAGSIKEFDIPCRYITITKNPGRKILQEHAIGYCKSELAPCRPKKNEIAVMFFNDGRHFWFHLRKNEFDEVFGDML